MELRIDSVAVALGGRRVLEDVSATLRPGRMTVVLGPNGAGKSTLLRAAAGLLPLAGGTITLDGADVAAMPPRERARAIGYLPQDATAHWNMIARELVALGRLPHRSPHAAPATADEAAIDAALTATDAAAFATRPVLDLSGGERARVLLARVLAGEPRWLLADEPLAGLDPAHQIELLDRLRDVAGQGRGVVVVLHDLVQAARVADEVLLLEGGRLVAVGPVADVLTPDRVAQVFGVTVAMVAHAGRSLPVPVGRR